MMKRGKAATLGADNDSVLGFGRVVDVIVLLVVLAVIVATVAFFRIHKQSPAKEPMIVRHSHEDYEVLEIYNLLSREECQEVIAAAIKQGMQESDVLSYGTSTGTTVNDTYRKSKTAWMTDETHPLCMRLALFSEQITGIPRENQEMLQVAHYEPMGKFNEHFDACIYDDKEYCEKMNNYAGQRRSTLLIYLNDDFQGGETEFVSIGLKIKPEAGKAILFFNVDKDENIIEKSKHRGNPVVAGEKWICTKWSHMKKYGS